MIRSIESGRRLRIRPGLYIELLENIMVLVIF